MPREPHRPPEANRAEHAPGEVRARRARRPAVRRTALPADPRWKPALALCETYYTTYGLTPTAAQRATMVALPAGDDVLLAAPTGSGKTLAAALPSMARLQFEAANGGGCALVIVVPVRALVAQHAATLRGIAASLAVLTPGARTLRVGARSGDSTAAERRALAEDPPDVLLVTPESLAVVLATEARASLAAAQAVVLDEAHLLAQGKRGALLAATLETLGRVRRAAGGARPQRLGMSATAEPSRALCAWLGGALRPARPVVVPAADPATVEIVSAGLDSPYPGEAWHARRALPAVARAVAGCEGTTLVFVASRPRAERWTQALRDVLPERMTVACFHGSMSADERGLVATKLRAGELRAVVATSSLELGLDVECVSQVLLLGAPSSVTQLVQSAGRSGHRPGGRAAARVLPGSAPELIAAIAAARCAARGEIEPVVPRPGDLDVALQAILGLCAAGPASFEELRDGVRAAMPFASLSDDALSELLAHLTARGGALSAYDETARLTLGPEGFALAGARARRDYLRRIGTITDEPAVRVRSRGRLVGSVDGRFASILDAGERFALSGRVWRVVSRAPDGLEVEPDPRWTGTVAHWAGQRISQSEVVTAEVERLLGELDALAPRGAAPREGRAGVEAVATAFGVAAAEADALCEFARVQRSESVLPSPARWVVELLREGPRLTVIAHTFAGQAANEVIGRAAAARMRRGSGSGVELGTSDGAVSLTVRAPRGARPDEETLRTWFAPDALEDELRAALDGSALARQHFRDVARVAQLTGPGGGPGAASPSLLYDVLRKHEPDGVLMRALEHTLWSALDGPRAARVLASAQHRRWHVVDVTAPSALAIPVLAQGARDALAPDDLEAALAGAAHALYVRHGRTELP